MKQALYFEKLDNNKVQCLLCPHQCQLVVDKSGICGTRKNVDGVLQSLNYGVVSSTSMDPIEKKPLYHFYPGEQILSLGTLGCNMHCPFCQNHHISRYYDNTFKMQPHEFAPADVLRAVNESNSFGVAYTYSEPLVWYEFVLDSARLVAESGEKNVLVSNGQINPEPLKELVPFINAANIDVKAFTEANYKKLGGDLATTKKSVEIFLNNNVHIELTTLVVPQFNDDLDELEELVKWIASLGRNIPFHISRYHPQYRYSEPATSIKYLKMVEEMAATYLNYVYIGNIVSDNATFCPECGCVLIERTGYHTRTHGMEIRDDVAYCKGCGAKADIIVE